VWQEIYEELGPKGLEIVTVGLDAAGVDACRPFIEAAHPTHPSLIDTTHQMAEAFGVVNIPNGVWIGEDGVIVRPAEPANPRSGQSVGRYEPIDGLPDHMNSILEEASRIQLDDRYVPSLRDWVEHGPDSPHALSPDEVVRRSTPRDPAVAEGQAHFELGAHLWQSGDRTGAEEHWRVAHRLHPENFAYKRQAWSLASPGTGPFERFWQGPVPEHEAEWPYDSDWLSEVRDKGAENYYPSLDL
jgi:hypothetical protein